MGSGADDSDDLLGSGYYNEFVSDVAGVSREAPEQDELEQSLAEGRPVTALPTEGELENPEAFEETAGFFQGEGTGVDLTFGDDTADGEDGGFDLL